LVTSHSARAAQNFGYEEHFEHGLRYEMADEWIELVQRLLASWEPDAVVLDEDSRTYADHTKVHEVNFEGRFHKSRGPLNTLPLGHGQPVICQAGASPVGRDFAAKHSDTIVARLRGISEMKAFRADISERLIAHGRKPTDCKVLFTLSPIVGETREEAQAAKERSDLASADIEQNLAQLSWLTGVDYSEFDLDAPMPEISTNAARSSAQQFVRSAGQDQKTLRDVVSQPRRRGGFDAVGTPDDIAALMGEAMEEIGGDGFLLEGEVTRRVISGITDGLVPALQRRGLTREHYSHRQLRANLLEF